MALAARRFSGGVIFLIFLQIILRRGDSFSGRQKPKQWNNNNACDFYQGSWVYDASYPLYDASNCPFIGDGFKCRKNGRPDTDYLKFRWQPRRCDLPRFNGEELLERYRGKKIMLVGDSLSNNMWQSLTCMLHTAVPNSNYTLTTNHFLSTFLFPEYGTSIMYLKNGFLVDLVEEKIGKVLKLDSISRGEEWKSVDFLIFNTYHWWTHTGHYKTWDFFQVGSKLVKEMDRMEAFKIGLTTWGKWLDSNINPSKTIVFFQGVSAVHIDGNDWGEISTKNCQGEKQPIKGSRYPGPSLEGEAIVKSVLNDIVTPVYLLDVTLLTQLRKDGHPSNYTTSNSSTPLLDCSHWCLPGVPDTWNLILFTTLFQN
ncbi:hypothetical protein IC582_016666 [Cucumis melo]